MDELRIVALNGCLGYGYDLASLDAGMTASPHLLGADAGSTDPGPYYLGSGASLVKDAQIERDLAPALAAALAARVPLVIGSAGMAGASANLAHFLEILHQVARNGRHRFRLAVVRSDVPQETVARALREGRITPMSGAPELTEDAIHASTQIVAQVGTDTLTRALDTGADVVVAGRACDTAIYASLPIARGFDPALALHMAKILECGAQCAIPLAPNDSLLGVLRRDHFLVRPLAQARVCTPASVAAHTMYEQPSPFELHEPEGVVDLAAAQFTQVDARTVRVEGASLRAPEGPQRLKLEGARRVGYRSFVLAGIRDPQVIANLDRIEETVRAAVGRNLGAAFAGVDYQLSFRYYGRDAVLGGREPERRVPHEVGALIEAIAPEQEMASVVLSLARSSFLHCPFPGRRTTAGNLAFPFSPSDFAAGPVYEFSIYHLMERAPGDRDFAVELVNV